MSFRVAGADRQAAEELDRVHLHARVGLELLDQLG
jgi:hypothetical protein